MCSYFLIPSRKSGRGVASSFTWKDVYKLNEAKKKTFTREWGKWYGFETGVEDIKIMLSLQKPAKYRHLDPKKRLQLGNVFQNAIMGIIEQDHLLVKRQIALSKVEISPSFGECHVTWLAKGDGSDDDTAKLLTSAENSIRVKLSQHFGNVLLPKVKFVMDDKHLRQQKMDELFQEADYGMQYRAVSHVGAILGSLSDAGPSSNINKTKKLPWLEKVKQRKESDKTTESS